MNYVLILLNIVLLVAGQTMWKHGITTLNLNGIKSMILAMFTPWVLAGIFLYGIATVVWIYLLKQMPLSVLYPMQSLAYIGAIIISMLVFHEHVPPIRWIGVGIIMVGVSLIAVRS